jgi:hypothetical protein
MVTHAMIWIMAKNPRAGERIREVFDHGEVTWQGVIAHHPKYDKSCEAWIVGNETWAAFSLAAIDSGKHGQNSALWCISLEPTAQPLIVSFHHQKQYCMAQQALTNHFTWPCLASAGSATQSRPTGITRDYGHGASRPSRSHWRGSSFLAGDHNHDPL